MNDWSRYLREFMNVLMGSLATLIISISPFLILLLVAIISGQLLDSNSLSFINGLEVISTKLTIAFLTAFIAACFLRFIYLSKVFVTKIWNAHTPPLESTNEVPIQTTSKSPQKIFQTAKNRVRWSVALAIILPVITFFILILVDEFAGIESLKSLMSQDTASRASEIIAAVPILGDLSVLSDLLPGQSMLGKILYTVTIAPLIITFRNLAYIFENIEAAHSSDKRNTSGDSVYVGLFVTCQGISIFLGALITYLSFIPN